MVDDFRERDIGQDDLTGVSHDTLSDPGIQSIRGPSEQSLVSDEIWVSIHDIRRCPVGERQERMSELVASLSTKEREHLQLATTVLSKGEGVTIDDHAGQRATLWYVEGRE